MAWIRETIKIRKGYNKEQREVIAQEIIDFIVERTESGFDKRNEPFPSYSESYKNSKKFRIGGKSAGRVNLTLSSEMLNSLKVLRHSNGEVIVGFDRTDNRNNDVAEGNIKGSYGKKIGDPDKARDFLGIKSSDKASIQDKYPLRNKKKLSDALKNFFLAKTGAEDTI